MSRKCNQPQGFMMCGTSKLKGLMESKQVATQAYNLLHFLPSNLQALFQVVLYIVF